MIKDNREGKGSCAELINLMGHKTCLMEWSFDFSKRGKHFKKVGKKSWKMRAILLIHFIIYFYDDTNSDVVINAIQAYSQG